MHVLGELQRVNPAERLLGVKAIALCHIDHLHSISMA